MCTRDEEMMEDERRIEMKDVHQRLLRVSQLHKQNNHECSTLTHYSVRQLSLVPRPIEEKRYQALISSPLAPGYEAIRQL